MNTLRGIATRYHRQANKIAAKGDKTGRITAAQLATIDFYRDSAAKLEALVPAEDGTPSQVWNLEGQERVAQTPKHGVTTRDKAAHPKELIEKAKGN